MSEQGTLFENPPDWRDKWGGMPEFQHGDLTPWRSIKVHFASREDRQAFADLVQQSIGEKMLSMWYPAAEIGVYRDKQYETARDVVPRYPIYIVSKGRWESRLTAKHLDRMRVPYFVVVEEQELEQYAAVIPRDRLLVLDKQYQRDYDTFDGLGDTQSKGPGPARNFAWDHSIASGYQWHWVMDDNIAGFFRFNKNLKVPARTGAVFLAMESFVDRYGNIAMAGPNYFKFVARKTTMPAFVRNTRIYSCNLIRNNSPFRWRGRYNEDTDLSLRMLKAGFATVQFNAFLQDKATNQTIKGGNSIEFYEHEGTLPKSKMQVAMHPDVSSLTWRFNRWHHYVDYSPFKKNRLSLDDVEVPKGIDNFGMVLKVLT